MDDTLLGLFVLWQPEALRLLLRAMVRHSVAWASNGPLFAHGETVFEREPCPLFGSGHEGWRDAIARVTTADAPPLTATQLRACALAALAMSVAARHLLFADSVVTRTIMQSRPPLPGHVPFFLEAVVAELRTWQARNYTFDDEFVRACYDAYYGMPPRALPRPMSPVYEDVDDDDDDKM